MKAQKAKMKGNEGPKGQKLENAAGRGADKICLNFIRKRAVFPRGSPDKPKMKEMKAQKAKMKGNESPKGQNERK